MCIISSAPQTLKGYTFKAIIALSSFQPPGGQNEQQIPVGITYYPIDQQVI
jgi:hypothetical protein